MSGVMRAVKARATFIPALNSVYLTDYSEDVVAKIKSLRELHLGGDKYLGKGVWEVSKEEWEMLKSFPHSFIDRSAPSPVPTVFEIKNDGKYLYQEQAAEELRNRTEALLFFDTGTGKTRTSLLALSYLASNLSACIVVGESNLSVGWMEQVNKHFPQMADRFVVLNDGSSIPQRIKKINESKEGTIFIVNIESVRNTRFVGALNARNLAVVVLDECQCIIGTGSQQTGGMHALKSDFRWALSATPIRNSPLEWHSLLAWLRVVPLENTLTRFKEYYGVAVRNKFGQWEYTSFRNEEDLEDLKNLVSIRVEKSGLGLPDRVDSFVSFEPDENYLSIMRQIDKERKKAWIDAKFTLFGHMFEAENPSSLFYIERVATALCRKKVEYILRQKELPMVVVSCLKFPLDYLHSLMPEDSVLYHGDISASDREQAKRDFISGRKRVFLMTRKSGGTGLDGLQARASLMMFLDVPENKAYFTQCADRLHRNGQTKEVSIQVLQLTDSVDIYAWQNLSDKQSWIDRYYKVSYEGVSL